MSQVDFDPAVGCPLCGGEVRYNKSRGEYQCTYCRRRFSVGEEEPQEDGENKSQKKDGKDPLSSLDPNLFEVELVYNELKDDCRQAVDHFCKYTNRFRTSEEMIAQIKKEYSWDEDISMPGLREEKMSKVKSIVGTQLQPGEEIILYVDDGVFIKGKAGFLITNYRTFFSNKRWKAVSWHKEIFIIEVSGAFWELNTMIDTSLDSIGASNELQGACAALICKMCFEQDPEHDPIRLIKG